MRDIGEIIETMGLHVKDLNVMTICRILSIHKFNIIDLTAMEVTHIPYYFSGSQ